MPRTKKDRDLVASGEQHEVDTAQRRMKKEGIQVSDDEIKSMIAAHGRGRTKLYKLLKMHDAVKGLLYMSEQDHPFEVVTFSGYPTHKLLLEKAQKGPDTKITSGSIENLLNQEGLQDLKNTLISMLSNPVVYKVGEVEIDVFIVGKLHYGGYAGLRVKAIET